MDIKRWLRPFESVDRKQQLLIAGVWLLLVMGYWFLSSAGSKHLFPTPGQVWEGFRSLYNEGLVVHVVSSLGLCLQATLLSILVSLLIVYLSPLPVIRPVAQAFSKLRYLPLTGITFYLAILVKDARTMQVSVLFIFMSLYFITSLLSVLKDIPAEEIDHARSLKCSRWEVLWEVVIKGRLDYVIDVLRQNLSITWMMLVTVESILVAAGGLGVLIKNSDKFMNHGRIVALQLVILLVGLLLDRVLHLGRKAFFKYSTF
ncbi:ABC transporter permease [Paraflavitalea pollutisoli]|uniref:ABC transporter permease n=1 Tax=Paraflavitalea pollutisoli TaxID=3034143 RepID=UPI0023EB3F99|nr:ABC transporter permease subunit [Paraflavitalea sp. H1-2-19X]